MSYKMKGMPIRVVVGVLGVVMAAGTRVPAVAEEEPAQVVVKLGVDTELVAALAALKDLVQREKEPAVQEVEPQKQVIDKYSDSFGQSDTIIKAAFDLVATYDKVKGPLWVAREGFSRGTRRKLTPPPNDIHWTIYTVMQDIMDRVYTPENIARYGKALDGFKFGSSSNFPGAVEPPADPHAVYSVKVNASCAKPFKHAVMHEDRPARRPTGAYAAPGSIVTVTVPPALVNRNYKVRVGAQSWDNSNKVKVPRLDRSSLVYPITAAEVRVTSPLGGGIYVEVPLGGDAGVVEVAIRNAVRSPFFSATSCHKTSPADWRETERSFKAPWADFQTDKFLMQVPTSWITKLDDPVTLMENWDKAMDALNDLMGLPRVWGKETLYLQVDLQNRAPDFAPGYPTCNDRYDPKKDYNGYANHYLVRGPQFAPDYVFHEQGHGFLFVKFEGEQESTVNLLHVAAWNQKFGYSLDEAFRGSREGGNTNQTLDNTAVEWMASLSFAAKRPMAAAEKAYQLKGHAKFVDIARLFGWKTLGDFWKTFIEDDEKGEGKGKRGYGNDELSLRLSQAAGVDLTPLLQFWGTPPDDAKALKAAVAAAKLPPSAKVYDTLVHYQSLVPRDNAAFRDFALKWWGKQPSDKGFWTEREHAKQWQEYKEETAAQIKQTVRDIMDEYFPKERPEGR